MISLAIVLPFAFSNRSTHHFKCSGRASSGIVPDTYNCHFPNESSVSMQRNTIFTFHGHVETFCILPSNCLKESKRHIKTTEPIEDVPGVQWAHVGSTKTFITNNIITTPNLN